MPLYQTYLELYPEGESARHIRCVESLGFSYGHRRKDIIGDGINRATESDCCAHHRMSVIEIGSIPVDRTDIKPKIEFRLFFGNRVANSFRRYHPFVPISVTSPSKPRTV